MIETSKSYFDSLGGEWDRLREAFFSETVREKALDCAAVEHGKTAVDLGAGTGFITQGLVARGLRVVAIDQSAAMLEALCSKFRGNDAVDCHVANADALPVESAGVDYCFANMLLHHVEAPLDTIREMTRIVRPGGQVVVTDMDAHTHEFLKTEHHDRWMGFRRETIRQWFRDAGLSDVSVEGIGEQCCDTSCAGDTAVVSIFLAIGKVV